jgi:hypothetical protein
MSKQTAVDGYHAHIRYLIGMGLQLSEPDRTLLNSAYKQAKAMEKEKTEENMAKAITFGWELSQHHRLNTEEKLLQMQKDFITSVIEGGDK